MQSEYDDSRSVLTNVSSRLCSYAFCVAETADKKCGLIFRSVLIEGLQPTSTCNTNLVNQILASHTV